MAAFSTAYGLCSLIDQKGFLHVSPDEDDCAVIALGKNIIIRYRLSDQKQLNSWSTIQKLSSSVAYDSDKNVYYTIFNKNSVKSWSTNDGNLEKVKKIKLRNFAHQIIIYNGLPLVLFASGSCCELSYAEDKSNLPLEGFLPENAEIRAAKIINSSGGPILLIISSVEKKTCLYSISLDKHNHQILSNTLKETQLKSSGRKLLACCLITRDQGETLLSFWSDGFLYGLPLYEPSEGLGTFLSTVRTVSTNSNVTILPLSANHIAVYGGDPSEEGAILAIYNLDFGMVQASTSFKFLQSPARLWAVDGKLVLGVGLRLVCVPYTLHTGSVAALIGSRSLKLDASSSDIVSVVPTVDWENVERKPAVKNVPPVIKNMMEVLSSQGFSEAGISESVVESLIKTEDIINICWCLENFIDLPERLLAHLLNLALTVPQALLERCNGLPENYNSDESNPISPPERAALVTRIFSVPITVSSLTLTLRKHLCFDNCLILINFITYQLSSDYPEVGDNALEWATALVDAFYQQFLLLKDFNALCAIKKLNAAVQNEIGLLNELEDLVPILLRLRKNKGLQKSRISKTYSIQYVQLFK